MLTLDGVGRLARKGRPRKQRVEKDYGTPELQLKRLSIAPSDPSLASNPLDALKARGIISPEAHTAAVHFLACRSLIFGNSQHPKAIDMNRVTRGVVEFMDNEGAEAAYRDACAMLKARSSQIFNTIENIVIHERWPDWFYKHVPGRRAKQHAMEGFAALLAWHQGVRRDAMTKLQRLGQEWDAAE